jgi:hypothetical protein
MTENSRRIYEEKLTLEKLISLKTMLHCLGDFFPLNHVSACLSLGK